MSQPTSAFSEIEIELCARYLRDLFGPLGRPEIERILAVGTRRLVRPAEVLFAQGDSSGSFFVVLSGRLRVTQTRADGVPKTLGDVARGEPVGEIAFFTKAPRTASVVGIKHSLLLEISHQNYLQLVSDFPGMSLALTQFVVHRLRQNSQQAKSRAVPKTVAVLNLCRTLDLQRWAADVKDELRRMEFETYVVTAADGGSIFETGRPPSLVETQLALRSSVAALPPPDQPTVESEGLNILLGEETATNWTRACITYADIIVLAVDFSAPPELTHLEKQLGLYSGDIAGKRVFLLLVHPDDAPVPKGTERWLDPRRVDLHIHVRLGHERDRRRFCRILTNRAVGLVLGGGGAKGMGHLGAVQALLQSGLEFDFIGGTSAGALFGAVMSQHDYDWDKIAKLASAAAKFDPTGRDFALPFLALKSGRKMRQMLERLYGDSCLEDLWINTFCLTSNYSAARPIMLERGLTRKMVEASIAIPGVFPPVFMNGHMHVDGGVFDNLPIEFMVTRPVRHIVAVALQIQEPREVALEQAPGSWHMLIDRLTGRRRFRLPSLPSILINSLTINSNHKQVANRELAEFIVELDLRKFGLLDWSKWRECWAEGHKQMAHFLQDMPVAQQFWERPARVGGRS